MSIEKDIEEIKINSKRTNSILIYLLGLKGMKCEEHSYNEEFEVIPMVEFELKDFKREYLE